MTQPDLFQRFGQPLVGEDPLTGKPAHPAGKLPPHSEPTTSREAAKSIAPTAAALRDKVLAYLRSRGAYGATDEETQESLQMPGNTQRPRRSELVEERLVRDSEKTRTSKSGRAAKVWVASEFFSK